MPQKVAVPQSLGWLGRTEEGAAWLSALPTLFAECADRWSLRLGDPFPYAKASLALPVTTPDGTPAVLKVQFPDRESEHQALALELWDGDGAVRLYAYDAERHALLLERCLPGTPLWEIGAPAALDVMVELLPRLWKRAEPPIRPLADEAAWWTSYLPDTWERAGRPFERTLLDAALDALETLPATQGEQVLLHQDLHADNVLRAEREPWLVIDPTPLVGEREFGIAPLVRGGELGERRDDLHHRLDRLSSDLSLDRERARLWTLAQTIAWSFEGDRALADHIEKARWLLELG